ncbi:MAG: GNAT family N-acetyltransferase, partial [Chitinivibrionales bacterium]|nr:GNAT family N-acetyltransferase [Chitinivibrionales bacterium]
SVASKSLTDEVTKGKRMNTRIYTDVDEMNTIFSDWDYLYKKNNFGNPFHSPLWVRSWYQAFPEIAQSCVIGHYDDSTLNGCMHLKFDRISLCGIPLRRAAAALNSFGCYTDVMINPGSCADMNPMIQSIAQHHDWDVLHFSNVLSDSALFSFFTRQNTDRYPVILKQEGISPYLPIEGAWEDFIALKRKQHKNIKIKFTKYVAALKNNDFSFVDENYCFHNTKALEEIVSVESKSWQGKEKVGLFNNSQRTSFFKTALLNCFRNKELFFFVGLKYKEKLIAYQIGMRSAGRITAFSTAYDNEFFSYSPGSLINLHMLNHCFTNDIKELDYCMGDHGYKLEFCTEARQLYQVYFFRNSHIMNLVHACMKFRQMAKKVLRKQGIDGGKKTISISKWNPVGSSQSVLIV